MATKTDGFTARFYHKQGPAKPDPMYECLKDVFNRRFTVANMKRILKNGEEVNRPW
jgi:hypothetical protein